MSCLSGLPASVQAGSQSGTITLSIPTMISDMGITGHFASSLNYKSTVFNYSDGTGIESRSIVFPIASNQGVFAISANAPINTWVCKSITILDTDGGTFTVYRDAFTVGGTPNLSQFDIPVISQFGSGNLRPERTDAFSFSIWLKRLANGVNTALFSNMQGATTFRGITVNISAANQPFLYLVADDGTNNEILRASTTTITNDGNWHHFACTYDGSSSINGIHLYIDGVEPAYSDQGSSITGSIVGSGDCLLGAAIALGGYYFNGNIDEFAFYRGLALSSAQVSAIYSQGASNTPGNLSLLPTVSNLTAWYRFGDTNIFGDVWSGGSATIIDRSGISHTVTPQNTSGGFSSTVKAGGTFSDMSALFDGTNDSVLLSP